MQRPAVHVSSPPIRLSREPIFNQRTHVLGYQIRAVGPTDCGGDAHDEAARLLEAAGPDDLDAITGGHLAFVRVNRRALVDGLPDRLAPERFVVELPPDLDDSGPVRTACASLRTRGYRLAIAGFSETAPAARLVEFASYLKVPAGPPESTDGRARTVACFRPGVSALIATGVNTPEQWEAAARDGFQYVQGFFFGRPQPGPARKVSGQQVTALRLLKALNQPNLSIGQLEDLVKHDAGLCYWLLRTVNSAATGLPRTVGTIGEALLLLGRDVVRRWASLWAVAGLNAQSHRELIVMSAVRARACELVTRHSRDDELAGEAFLAGMLSLLDAMLGQPMPALLRDLPVSDAIRLTLCGEAHVLRSILDAVIAYERGEWEDCERLAARARFDARLLPGAFLDAMRWAREFDVPSVAANRVS